MQLKGGHKFNVQSNILLSYICKYTTDLFFKQVIAKCKSLNPGGKFGYHAADMDNYQTESKILIEVIF